MHVRCLYPLKNSNNPSINIHNNSKLQRLYRTLYKEVTSLSSRLECYFDKSETQRVDSPKMGRTPCYEKNGLNRGAWTALEDQILRDYVKVNGEGRWGKIPNETGRFTFNSELN